MAALAYYRVKLFVGELVKAPLEWLLVASPAEAESYADQDLELLVMAGLVWQHHVWPHALQSERAASSGEMPTGLLYKSGSSD